MLVFKPIDFGPLKRSISNVVSAKFGDVAGGGWSVHVDDGVLDRLAGAAWTAGASATSLEAWADEVLCPNIRQLKHSLSANDVDGATVSLSAVEGSSRRKDGEVTPRASMSTYVHRHAYFSRYSCIVFREDDTTAFADVDKAARRPTPLTGATEDHPPTKEDPASTAEGDTTAPVEVSASTFLNVDEAARRPTPLTGATEDRTPMEEDPASTTEGDTTAPSEVSPIAFADANETARRLAPLIGVIEDRAPTTKDPATTAEGAPTSVVVATTEGDITATAEVSSTIVAEPDDPIAAVNLAASTIDDD
ncbi:hypothetical protein E2562_030729 [Oryza meyeriana var. granulata]|uniref:SMAX1-like AAA+ ATPase lid domain-containing protein n=1 Tax=Oryza meyeriana var. granulata TaxID=110450 RepID=A0A6G1E3E9_9ORYZ|nr:hypothetical protein E2562_030729 [Oryza meyeriana var. granulata]